MTKRNFEAPCRSLVSTYSSSHSSNFFPSCFSIIVIRSFIWEKYELNESITALVIKKGNFAPWDTSSFSMEVVFRLVTMSLLWDSTTGIKDLGPHFAPPKICGHFMIHCLGKYVCIYNPLLWLVVDPLYQGKAGPMGETEYRFIEMKFGSKIRNCNVDLCPRKRRPLSRHWKRHCVRHLSWVTRNQGRSSSSTPTLAILGLVVYCPKCLLWAVLIRFEVL